MSNIKCTCAQEKYNDGWHSKGCALCDELAIIRNARLKINELQMEVESLKHRVSILESSESHLTNYITGSQE